jgi:hypothetical protein
MDGWVFDDAIPTASIYRRILYIDDVFGELQRLGSNRAWPI